ncbi:hypothetical protein [Arthrobacter sp. ZGTC412]|uniref:hypothetical protein n=1 Tax=Arthrobacter sp. ZGTC412 TaxID=2058900 RepID=UPI0011B033E2|nr:hypothetical protein [Arthrobacter sp. ZGTC412]
MRSDEALKTTSKIGAVEMTDSASEPSSTGSADSSGVTLMLPDDIFNKRNASHVPTMLILLAIAVVGIVLLATQNHILLLILLVGSMAGLAVFGKPMTKRFMANANREMAKYITTSLVQSKAFEHALYETLSNEVFTRSFRKSLASNYEMEYLEVRIEPSGEPTWTIQMLQGAKGYRLRRVAERPHI